MFFSTFSFDSCSGQNSVWTSGIVQLKKVYPKESLKLNKNVWEFYKRVSKTLFFEKHNSMIYKGNKFEYLTTPLSVDFSWKISSLKLKF